MVLIMVWFVIRYWLHVHARAATKRIFIYIYMYNDKIKKSVIKTL